MPPTLTRTDEALEINLATCRGAEFTDTLAKVREIPGRRFDGQRKLWLLPPEPALAEKAVYAMGAEVEPEVTEWIRASKQRGEFELVSVLPDDAEDLRIPWATARAPWQPKLVNGSPVVGLKPHQRAFVSAAAAQDEVRAILADDLGLGKTVQAISVVAERLLRTPRDPAPKLVVCPNSVKGVWAREVPRWLGPDEPVVTVNATTAKARANQLKTGIEENAWIIVNYEQLRVQKVKVPTRSGGTKTVTKMKEPLFESTVWAAVIADEVHRAKNRKASQTQGLFRVRAPIMLGATGTPIMNSPDEAWAPLHWLFPTEFTSYWRFYSEYVDFTEGYFGKVITGVKNPDALRFVLQGRLYRRTKKQVLNLPEKTRITVDVELSDKARKLYTEAERGLWLEVEKAMEEGDASAAKLAEAAARGTNLYTIPNGAARTVRLRQVLSTPALLGGDDFSDKLDSCQDMIIDNRHKQHVVFSEFVETCSILAERLRKHGLAVETYTGKTKDQVRAALEDSFQAGEIDVLVGTIGAMREGITLTASDTVHFIERAWVPAWNDQAESRCHRVGTKNSVSIYIYQAANTIDDMRVLPTNRLKERIVSTVIPQDPIQEAVQ